MSFVAISKVSFLEKQVRAGQAIGLQMLPIAKKQKGIISISFHLAANGTQTMMYSEWQSEQDYQACFVSAEMTALMEQSGATFADSEFTLETFTRLA